METSWGYKELACHRKHFKWMKMVDRSLKVQRDTLEYHGVHNQHMWDMIEPAKKGGSRQEQLRVSGI